MEDLILGLFGILCLATGTGLFIVLNKKFNIYYFGFAAIAGVWIGCVIVAGLLVKSVLMFIVKHYIISALIAIGLFYGIRSYVRSSPSPNEVSEGETN